MRIEMVRMREKGVELPRRVLHDRYAVKHWGSLTIEDVTSPALRRVVKMARLALDTGDRVFELLDAQISWVNEQNFALKGVRDEGRRWPARALRAKLALHGRVGRSGGWCAW